MVISLQLPKHPGESIAIHFLRGTLSVSQYIDTIGCGYIFKPSDKFEVTHTGTVLLTGWNTSISDDLDKDILFDNLQMSSDIESYAS